MHLLMHHQVLRQLVPRLANQASGEQAVADAALWTRCVYVLCSIIDFVFQSALCGLQCEDLTEYGCFRSRAFHEM